MNIPDDFPLEAARLSQPLSGRLSLAVVVWKTSVASRTKASKPVLPQTGLRSGIAGNSQCHNWPRA